MRGSLFVGLDVGTQSAKAVVLDVDAQQIVARASAPLTTLAGLPPGHVEQHPSQWLDAVVAASRAALAGVDAARVAGIGVSGQQHGAVVLDEHSAPVRAAKLWCDTSTAAEAAELGKRLGRVVPVGFTASKLLWLARHEPERWARVRTVLLPHDWINLWLTGEASMEFGDASGTGFFDVQERAFDPVALAAVDARLPSLLPPLRAPGALAGALTATAAAALGLAPGIPVATGGGDNMMAAIGAGATRAGVVVVSLGTSGTIFTRTDGPVADPQGLVAPFCSSDGGWLPLLCVMNCTAVTEEVRALTGLDHAALTSAAREAGPGAGGLLLVPFLAGERVPALPDATGTLLGVRTGSLRAGPLYRAALEGTTLALAAGLDRLRALGLPVDEVRVTGGGAANALWRQILADTFQTPVHMLAETESAALGAAVQAAWAARRANGETALRAADVAAPFVRLGKRHDPDPAVRDVHAALRRRYHDAVQRLHGTPP